MYALKHHRNSLKNTNRRTVTEMSLLDSNSSTNTIVTNNGHQAMLVKTSRTQLPKIEKASHVQIDSIQNIFGATTTNLMGNGFNFHHHQEHSSSVVNGDAANAHEIPLRPSGLNNSTRDIFEETPKGPRKKQTMAIAGQSAVIRGQSLC